MQKLFEKHGFVFEDGTEDGVRERKSQLRRQSPLELRGTQS
jgi:hypothetical protein